MNNLKVKTANIIGRSVGGRVATEFTYHYPDRVKAVVLQHPVLPSDGMV